jgi:hypothetical protein
MRLNAPEKIPLQARLTPELTRTLSLINLIYNEQDFALDPLPADTVWHSTQIAWRIPATR